MVAVIEKGEGYPQCPYCGKDIPIDDACYCQVYPNKALFSDRELTLKYWSAL